MKRRRKVAETLADAFLDFARTGERARLNRRLNLLRYNFAEDRRLINRARRVWERV